MLHLAASSGGLPEAVIDRIRVIPIGKGMAGLAVERRRTVDSCNIQTDETGDVRPGAKLTGMQGAIAVPMFRQEQATGALGVASRGERTFTAEEIALLEEAGRRLAERS
jgi:GAF domain-containing protein